MPSRPSPEQKDIVGRVMHEFKHGELTGGGGRKVRNPRQAIAIALSESGRSIQQSPEENRRALNRTRQRERVSEPAKAQADSREPTRAELYDRAKQAEIPGRSNMSKRALRQALEASRS